MRDPIPPSVSGVMPALSPVLLSSAVTVCLLLALTYTALKPKHGRLFGQRRSLPPGPRGYPVIGNVYEWRRGRRTPASLISYLISLADYGEMTTLTMGSRTWVFLNSPRVVNEIISKRGAITHERPPMPIASDLISRGYRSVLRPTAEWVEGRRIQHHLLNGPPLKTYGVWQEEESVRLLSNYLATPKRWYAHHYRYTNSITHRIVLGEGLYKDSAELDNLQRVTVEFLTNINSSIIDFFPQLAKLPRILQFWRRRWENMGQDHHDAFESWWAPVKMACDQGVAPPSFVRDALLARATRYTGSDEEGMYLAMSTISAGSDSTRMPMHTLVMAALCHPDAMSRAREEAELVCGGKAKRLPDLADMPNMLYTCALVKEVLRWRPPVPLVPQHQSVQDLEFDGYHFPSGTEFLINSFPVAHHVDGPDSFRPERWLDGNERNIAQGQWTFGGGRRICVGYKVAQAQLFVAFARLLYCFDFAPAGPYDSMKLGFGVRGEPFPVTVTVRSEAHEQLIKAETAKLAPTKSHTAEHRF